MTCLDTLMGCFILLSHLQSHYLHLIKILGKRSLREGHEGRSKEQEKSTKSGTSYEAATIEITDASLEVSQFNNSNTPGVKVSILSATDTMTWYRVEVLGRRNIGVTEVVSAILASLRGDSSAIQNQLGI